MCAPFLIPPTPQSVKKKNPGLDTSLVPENPWLKNQVFSEPELTKMLMCTQLGHTIRAAVYLVCLGQSWYIVLIFSFSKVA